MHGTIETALKALNVERDITNYFNEESKPYFYTNEEIMDWMDTVQLGQVMLLAGTLQIMSNLKYNANLKGYLENEIALVEAERMIDPASMARKWQGTDAYPGVDNWKNIILKKGTKIWGGTPGQSNFYTSDKMIRLAGTDATKIFKGLQVGKGNFPLYRPGMTLYEVTEDITVGYSKALANPLYGPGGFEQYFIPNYENVLVPIKSIILYNR